MNTEINKDEAVREIEISSELAQKFIEKGERWSRLLDNKDFKEAVVQGYFSEESERLVGLLADPEFDSAEKKQDLFNQMQGIANFRMKIVQDQRMASSMRARLVRNDEAIAELETEV